eukprot:CAMPEP_0194123918 /NCGR_PEP_ID=MMETSP0150-20130528/56526_1 /TAXON_ID=122233 /ORGANISM="Chaetoceros debilis, Strain MM31A-1" /LENGTH=2190 /DNA_ID=CAMNT_0038817389 /DNA_START=149 /DNA_END=6718 /DNA_ORIENTATION=-
MVKSVEPISFPHDGPFHHDLILHAHSTAANENNQRYKNNDGDGMKEAMMGLYYNQSDDKSQKSEKINAKVIQDLREAATLRDQLACLRSYRSTLLNLQKSSIKQKLEEEHLGVGNEAVTKTETEATDKSFAGMYRILLEFGFSKNTPHALKRASEACLPVLRSFYSDTSIFDAIKEEVVKSLLDHNHNSSQKEESLWLDAVPTLFDILSYVPTMSVILESDEFMLSTLKLLISQASGVEDILKKYYSTYHNDEEREDRNESNIGVIGLDVVNAVEKGVAICTSLKLILGVKDERNLLHHLTENSPQHASELIDLLSNLMKTVIIPLVRCRATSSDALSVCSVTLGHILLSLWKLNGEDNDSKAISALNLLELVISEESPSAKAASASKHELNVGYFALRSLPQLNKVAVVRGLVATLTNEVLAKQSSASDEMIIFNPIGSFVLNAAHKSTDNTVRLAALKCLETILARCQAILLASSHNGISSDIKEKSRNLSEQVLKVSLATWESPPSRQVGSAVPGLFQSLVKLMEVLDKDCARIENKSKSIDLLVTRVMAQPALRKGRYVALDALLPKVGATKLIVLAKSQGNGSSSELIVSFLNEIGRTGNSAGAVADLLSKLLSMLRIEMHEAAGVDLCQNLQGNKKERRKKEKKQILEVKEVSVLPADEEKVILLKEWVDIWIPPLVGALLSSDSSYRSKISSFFLPYFPAIMGGKGNKIDVSHIFAILLDQIETTKSDSSNNEVKLWAKFEVVRHASLLKLLKSSASSKKLRKSVARALPMSSLRASLTHEVSRLRLVAFQSIGSILIAYDDIAISPIEHIKTEIRFWTESLPYACKCSEREYIVNMSKALMAFMSKISDIEALQCSNTPLLEGESLLEVFVNDFLLHEIFCKHSAYPSTVSEKEKWALSMFEVIVSFASQNTNKATLKKKKLSKDEPLRRAFPAQEKWCRNIMHCVLSDDVISALLTMLNSMWDSTRSLTYDLVLAVLEYAHHNSAKLPKVFTDKQAFLLFQARAIHLASSPRQRESDTGARMLSILSATISSRVEQFEYIENISTLLIQRLIIMESSLKRFMSKQEVHSEKERSVLPLAHGLMQSITLIVEHSSFSSIPDAQSLLETIARTCFKAIELSLCIVADMKDSSKLENGDSGTLQKSKNPKSGNVPLNVNTGAIGANATFASLESVDDDEVTRRFLMQRVVMGTWLLIREACSTLSSTLEALSAGNVPLMSTAGDLLIITLTSLKHQGAAFASHKALQKMCELCYCTSAKNEIRSLPNMWSQRFLQEISATERVRDSTLRRSTGYGLGFLSILRSEHVSPRFMFPLVLGNIIRLSLPSSSAMEQQILSWDASMPDIFVFSKKLNVQNNKFFVEDVDYEDRSRIHAQNILRLIILDAPLANEMREFVGDSFISALIGYKDSSWAIRNSSTMTFAAAMLRVVDADKNAETAFDNSSSRSQSNAVTCKELFRRYPPLAMYLLSLIRKESSETSMADSTHPTLFPLLLLLARLQPLSLQRQHGPDDEISQLFIDPIINCIGHIHHKVRLVAARSLAVLCSGDEDDGDIISSLGSILTKCLERLSFVDSKYIGSHNQDHGALLTIRALLRSSQKPQKYFNGKLSKAVIYYATWCHFQFSSPPSCTAIAIEILHIVTKRIDIGGDQSFSYQGASATIQEIAFKLVRCVEEFSKRNSRSGMIGLSALAKSAAGVLCDETFSRIFDASTPSRTRQHSVNLTRHCFCSSNYDIMLYSVKAFKKGIYAAVDEVLELQIDSRKKESILRSISELSFGCLFTLVDRDLLKSHPPTIRRLSRIALEAIYAFKSLSPTGATSITGIIGIDVESIWPVLMLLLNLGGYVMSQTEKKAENLSGGNGLPGNALELVALALYENCNNLQRSSVSPATLLGRISLLVNLLQQSTHPLSSWKVRYSAAVAAKESSILSLESCDFLKMGPKAESLRLEIYLLLLELFQDSDEDVRCATGRALTKASVSFPAMALKNLEETSKEVSTMFLSSDMLTLLVRRLVHLCNDITQNLKRSMDEFSFTTRVPELKDILNLCSVRKIFEEEDANPFEEILIIIQTTIMRLSEFSSDAVLADEGVKTLFEKMYSLLRLSLADMKRLSLEIEGHHDFAHNLSYDSAIFPYLHGLILGSSLGLWFGVEGKDFVISASADEILQLGINIHPCIRRALQILKLAKKGR